MPLVAAASILSTMCGAQIAEERGNRGFVRSQESVSVLYGSTRVWGMYFLPCNRVCHYPQWKKLDDALWMRMRENAINQNCLAKVFSRV